MFEFQGSWETEGDPIKKIQDFFKKNNLEILVGFPSGRQHIPTLHRKEKSGKSKNAEYKSYGKTKPQDMIPVDTAELAKTLSFGTATIPARPFLKEGLDSKGKEINAEIGKQIELSKAGKKTNWQKVGTKAVGAIQEFVRGDYYKSAVPNSQKTIDYKGSDTPLIDGADMINALSFVIKEGKT